jgi:PPK2 family polyphosphate:nucleotide phosphotransferase
MASTDDLAARLDLTARVDLDRYRTPTANLDAVDPDDVGPYDGDGAKKDAARDLRRLIAHLAELQQRLHADGRFALLLVLQAMDAGGKDGTIRRALSGLNPQGVEVTSFKAPSERELAHDFLWRVHTCAPRRGRIGVFNRSHYEDVLVARVARLVPEDVWRGRYAHIRAFEALLLDAGTALVKGYLHVSKGEQAKRLRARLDEPEKRWKFDAADLEARARWDEYRAAYAEAFARCGPAEAPWTIVPADRKWYRDVVVATALVEALEALPLRWPEPQLDLERFRAML